MITIEEVRGLGEILKSYQWELNIIPPSSVAATIGSDILRLYADSASIPAIGSGQIQVSSGGHTLNYAGKAEYSQQWSVQLRTYENLDTIRLLRDWHQLQWDRRTGAQYPKADYEAVAMEVYLTDSFKNRLQTYSIYGAYIAQIGEVPLDYNSNAQISIPCTFTFDWMNTE